MNLVETRVKALIAQELVLEVEEVALEASIVDDLGADSLNVVELAMAFEEEFGMEIPDEDGETLRTVGDVIQYIEMRHQEE